MNALALKKCNQAKKGSLASGNRQSDIFYHLSTHIIECVSEYIFLIKTIKQKNQNQNKQANTKKVKKKISEENLTGYNDIVCEFGLCNFNLLDRVVMFSCLFMWILYNLSAARNMTVFVP